MTKWWINQLLDTIGPKRASGREDAASRTNAKQGTGNERQEKKEQRTRDKSIAQTSGEKVTHKVGSKQRLLHGNYYVVMTCPNAHEHKLSRKSRKYPTIPTRTGGWNVPALLFIIIVKWLTSLNDRGRFWRKNTFVLADRERSLSPTIRREHNKNTITHVSIGLSKLFQMFCLLYK